MSHLNNSDHKRINALLFALMALEGLVGLSTLFNVPSEPNSNFLFGYSISRIILAAAWITAVVVLGTFSVAAILQPPWWQRFSHLARQVTSSPDRLFWLLAAMFILFVAILAFLGLVFIAGENELETQRVIYERIGGLLIWVELCLLQFGLLIYINHNDQEISRPSIKPFRWSILLAMIIIVYEAAFYFYATTTMDIRMSGHEIIYLAAILGLGIEIHDQLFTETRSHKVVNHVLWSLFIFVCTYAIYRHTTLWAQNFYTPAKAYWHLLADSFLNGRLYLENPGTFHDLTIFNGRWYVPNPPLPAFIVMPFVALVGVDKINMVQFSIIIGSINAVLLFQVLTRSAALNIIPTSRVGNLLLVTIAMLGTSHWWLAIKGQMWFVAQLLTLTFTTLAVLIVLYKKSPWWVGICLGIALLSRPNAFTLWPFMAGIYLFLNPIMAKDHRQWKPFITWSVKSAIPVCLAITGLLYYNFIRFGNWLDFGYVSINSAEWLMDAVRTYGIFNVHFVPANLHAMFIKIPRIEFVSGCFYFSPTREGISILATTPAIIYIFRRIKINWWTIGAWVSIILSLGLLLFYHNTGSWQMGYRYLLDFMLPILFLMGLGIGKRPSWFFIFLVSLSIIINAAGIYWWFTEWWCKPGR